MNKRLLPLLACLLWAAPTFAQDYGTGVNLDVPRAPAGAITIDGVADEPLWDTAAMIDPLANADFFALVDEPDLEAEARLLWSDDTLYVYVHVFDNAFFVPEAGDAWQADQILIGIDPTHAADSLYDSEFGGGSANAPDAGPYAYKVWLEGITLNWGFDGIFPADSGWVNGVVFRDDDNLEWGVEAAFYVPQIESGAQIGFNIGGAQASQEAFDSEGEGTYGFYSWQVCEISGEFCTFAGGSVMSDARSFATLTMIGGGGGGEGYGTGLVVEVSQVDPATLVIDGNADEAAWADAQTVDVLANWGSFGDFATAEPDLDIDARMLWAADTLYLYVRHFDNELEWGTPSDNEEEVRGGDGDQLLIGIDATHAGDSLYDSGFGGAPENAPLGPFAYKVNGESGFTLNWSALIAPQDSGWVNAAVVVDEQNVEWAVEAALYVPALALGSEIGFNLGGAQARAEACPPASEECTYAFYSWQVCEISGEFCTFAGGSVMSDARSFATLRMVETLGTGVEETPLGEVPDRFALGQNYPNPFNPATTIEYGLKQSGRVTLAIYNALGQQVETLVDASRAAGTYRVRWEAADLPSGVYLYRLTVDDAVVATRSMLLVK